MYLTIGTADVFVITVLLYLTNTGAKQEPTLAVFLTYLLMSYWVFRVVRSDYIQPTVHGSPTCTVQCSRHMVVPVSGKQQACHRRSMSRSLLPQSIGG